VLKLLKRIMNSPRRVVTDGWGAYSAVMNEIGSADRHEVGRRRNNRAQNSHQPFRRRERAMQRFRSLKTLQKFGSIHAQVHNHSHGQSRVNSEVLHEEDSNSCLAIPV
jgi:putative transposase